MTEHMIRLRGGWTLLGRETEDRPTKLTLPLTSFPGRPGNLVFSRFFQRPPLANPGQTLWLQLESVPGLKSITINRQELARTNPEAPIERLFLGNDLPDRNQLVLSVDSNVRLQERWGCIALVIQDEDRLASADRSSE